MATQVERILNRETAGAFRYQVEIDVDSNSTHATIIRFAGKNKRVLELGCAAGHMSRILRDRGCNVTAVEIDRLAAEYAAQFCQRVIVGDLDQLDLEQEMDGERFDVVIAADVLEHLKDPAKVLRTVKKLLYPDGCVIVSIPNVAHLSVRLALLAGHFPYRETGLLDRTHLRFFTRESMEVLFDEAGVAIGCLHRIQAVPPDPASFDVPYDPACVPADVLDALSRDPEASTYQFIVVGYPLPREGLVYIQDRMKRLAFELESARREIADGKAKLQQEQAHAAEIAEASERSRQIIQAEAEERIARFEQQMARIQRRSEELSQALDVERSGSAQLRQINLEQKAQIDRLQAESEERISHLQQQMAQMQQRTEELSSALEAEGRESAVLRQNNLEQKAQLERVQANAEAMLAREGGLREMLLDAHDQLLRRDQEIAATVATTIPAPMMPALVAHLPATPSPSKYLQYQQLMHKIRELVEGAVPAGRKVLVINKGDEDLLQLGQCRGAHFPQGEDGGYAGYYPSDSAAAIAHLDKLLKAGARYLLIPQTALWWLDHYREFGEYLDRNFTRVINQADTCVLFDLTPREKGQQESPSVAPNVPEPVVQPKPAREPAYISLIWRITDRINRTLPANTHVLVVSRGDDELLKFRDRTGGHFPQAANGVYAGHNPADSAQAIGHLEVLRQKGGEYLVFPQTAFWWLDYYAEFRCYLDASYQRVWSDQHCVVYRLSKEKKSVLQRFFNRSRVR